MANEKLFQVGVKALIVNSENQILLLLADTSNHKSNIEPYWDIPGGRIQEGSSIMQTLAREVAEETGITTFSKAPELFATIVSKHEIPISDDQFVGLLLVVYKVTVADDAKILLSNEHTTFEWVAKDEATNRLHNKYPTEFINEIA